MSQEEIEETVTDDQILTRARPPSSERRAAMIKIAHAAFLSDGYAATSMSSIAAELGGSKATLYSYFPSKEDLFIAVVENKCEQLQAVIYETEMTDGDFGTALKTLARRFLQFGLSDEAIATYRLVTAESGRFPEIGRALYERGFRRGIARLAAYFERVMGEGRLRQADPAVAAEQFFELCKSGIHHRRLWGIMPVPTDAEIDAQAERAVATFIRAYGAQV